MSLNEEVWIDIQPSEPRVNASSSFERCEEPAWCPSCIRAQPGAKIHPQRVVTRKNPPEIAMSTRTYELTVPVRKGERGMGIVVNPENCVIELAADGPAISSAIIRCCRFRKSAVASAESKAWLVCGEPPPLAATGGLAEVESKL